MGGGGGRRTCHSTAGGLARAALPSACPAHTLASPLRLAGWRAGKLLADWRRVNVAITRAKSKLVLVGDGSTLAALDLFARLLALVRGRGWYLQLPAQALDVTAACRFLVEACKLRFHAGALQWRAK